MTSSLLDATLRTLDPADPSAAADSTRARADLARILATTVPAARSPRRARRRTVALVAAATTAAVGLVLLPGSNGGDAAFASWVADPTGLSGAARRQAVDQCTGAQQDGPGKEYGEQLAAVDVSVAEARGVWTAVYLAGSGGFSALCVTDESTRLFDDWVGSVGVADVPAPGPRDAVATDLGTATMSAGDLSLAAGDVGADVTGLVYLSASQGAVSATVQRRHFVLWLPGDELQDAGHDGVEVTLTLRDGRTTTTRLSL